MATNSQATKLLAIGTLKPLTTEQQRQFMAKEVSGALQIWLDEEMDQVWLRQDGKGAVFVMTTSSLGEANAFLKALALVGARIR